MSLIKTINMRFALASWKGFEHQKKKYNYSSWEAFFTDAVLALQEQKLQELDKEAKP